MNKPFLLLALACLLTGLTSFAQQKFTIGGTLKSKRNGQTLIGASVRSDNTGTTTNEYGFYSLTLPEGAHSLQFSSVGLQTQTIDIVLNKNMTLNLSLEEVSKDLEEVVVTAPTRGRSIKSTQMGI